MSDILEEIRRDIPDIIKVGGVGYKITWDFNAYRDHGSSSSASVNSWHANIAISYGDRSIDNIKDDLLHEIIEIINGVCDFKWEHNTISTLATMLHQTLRDNRLKFYEEGK